MKWVLIMYVYYQSAGAVTADFETREKCIAAGEAFRELAVKHEARPSSVRFICVEK
jgi:hypothetical protein